MCNSACVYHCINVHYHGTYTSALDRLPGMSSGTGRSDFRLPYCTFYCRHRFFSDPSELIRMHWIRPEDLPLYAREGITFFKLDGRDKEPSYLLHMIRAYLEGSYEGNFFHLMQPEFCMNLSDIKNESACFAEMDDRELDAWTDTYLREAGEWQLGISNRNLDGFAQAFADQRIVCRGNCRECGYCSHYAKKIRINPLWQQKMIQGMGRNLARYYGSESPE